MIATATASIPDTKPQLDKLDGGLAARMSQPRPFDAASFAAADADQDLAGAGVQFTVLENFDGRLLTKGFSASADGKAIDILDAARNSSSARAIRAGLDPAREFASLRDKVRSLKSNQAIITAPLPGTASCRQVIFKEQWEALPPNNRDLAGDGPVYRGRECFTYPAGQPALLELDEDTKDWPAAIQEKHRQAGGLLQAVLPAIDPQFKSAGYYAKPSSSAGVRNKITKEMLPTGAKHLFFVAEDGADIPRYCEVLVKRLVLAGYGFNRIAKDGTCELRSLIDLAASGRASRLWYDAHPILFDQHLELVVKYRQEQVREGPRLNTHQLKNLNDTEQAEYDRIATELEAAVKPDADRERETYIAARVERAVAAGVPRDEARRLAFTAVDGGRLDVDGQYRFDDGNWRSGSEILENVAAIDGKTAADPLEPSYGGGDNRAIWYRKPGEPGFFCHSHAHHGRVFRLAYDVTDWIALVGRASGGLPQRLAQLRDAGRHYWPDDHDQARAVLGAARVPSPLLLDFIDEHELEPLRIVTAVRAGEWLTLAQLRAVAGVIFDRVWDNTREQVEMGLVAGSGYDGLIDWGEAEIRIAEATAKEKTPSPETRGPVDKGPLDHRPEVDMMMRKMNERFFVVNDGKSTIFEEDTDEEGHPRYRYHSPASFKALHGNRRVVVAIDEKGKDVTAPAGIVWFGHPRRRQYDGGEVFDPQGRHRPDQFNRWQGWGVRPVKGDWSLMRAHMREVIANGDPTVDEYLMKWNARLVQLPWEVGQVVVVLRGEEGAGKGTFGWVLMRIAGGHGYYVSSADHLTGSFNDHLFGRVFVFADEAVFAGDRAAVNKLKSLATEPGQAYNGKHRPLFQGRNCAHVMMATNNRWVIPAGPDSRRWCVFDVSGARIGDHAYFAAIRDELQNGGAEAMLHDLLHMDLTGFNVFDYPVTAALIDQRDISLETDLAWLKDCLSRGYVWASACGQEDYFQQWHDELSTEILYRSYEKYALSRQPRRIRSREAFGRFMVSTGAVLCRLTDAVVGERRIGYGGELVRKPRPWGYALGPLPTAKAAFKKKTSIPV